MEQHNKSIIRFQTFIKEHNSANHQLFDIIETAAKDDSLTPEAYYLFAVNIAARTMLSLPEIHACCIQASLELDPLRTAYSVMTGAEEGGSGKPKEVHSILMMNALNYHGKVVFGLNPINLKYLMALVRLIYSCKKYHSLLNLENRYEGINQDLNLSSFINKDELIDTIIRMANIAEIELSKENLEIIREIDKIEKIAYERLQASKVLVETIDYCLEQLSVLGNMKSGYLQGVGFAHEALADGMINKMFRILYSQVSKYSSEENFIENVYPYFSAHGNYLEVYNGFSEFSEGIEVTHAQRELEKLSQLDESALIVAWVGANDFANRNVRIWDGIMNKIKPLPQINYVYE